jgi:hypothetical protein
MNCPIAKAIQPRVKLTFVKSSPAALSPGQQPARMNHQQAECIKLLP